MAAFCWTVPAVLLFTKVQEGTTRIYQWRPEAVKEKPQKSPKLFQNMTVAHIPMLLVVRCLKRVSTYQSNHH